MPQSTKPFAVGEQNTPSAFRAVNLLLKLVLVVELLSMILIAVGFLTVYNAAYSVLLSVFCALTLLPIHLILMIVSLVMRKIKTLADDQKKYNHFMFWAPCVFFVSCLVYGNVIYLLHDISLRP